MSKKVLVIIGLSIILLCILRSNFIGISKSPKIQATTIGFPTNMPAIYVEPSYLSASPGETFVVSVGIFNLTDSFWQTETEWWPGDELGPWSDSPKHTYSLGNLLGIDIQLGWDETVLKFVSNVTKIPVEDYSDGVLHAPIFKIRDEVNETHGFPFPQPEWSKYWLAYTSFGGRFMQPFNGNGTVLEVTFEVLKEGASNLNITRSQLSDSDGLRIPHKFFSAFFQSPTREPIYIRADGSIDPTTANITTTDNVTYTFTDNNYDEILVERSNIIIDGAGYTLKGSGSGNGFDWSGINNVTIQNTNIQNFFNGIWLDSSSSNSISGNNITANNRYGIRLGFSSNYNSIQGNHITNNGYGIRLYSSSNYNNIQGNNITSNNGYGILFESSSNSSIQRNNIANNWDGIWLYSSSNYNNIQGNNITSNNGYGILLYHSSNNSIQGNNITANNRYGIRLGSSSNNSIQGNNVTANNRFGIYLSSSSSNNSISGNNITANNGCGIWLDIYSNYNSIQGNNITANNDWGIGLYHSSDCSISGNNITANNGYGIRLDSSSNWNSISGNNIANNYFGIDLPDSSSNRVFHNNFINNTIQVYSINSVNIWDDGYPSGGNYWSNYTGVDSDLDGIGDSQHVIDANNQDNYPLMGMYSCFNVTSAYQMQTISNSTVTDPSYNGTAIFFDVTGENNTDGFCRITIPTALMNGTYRIFVNGTEVSPTLLPISNSTHSYLYFTYPHSTEEVVIIPEFTSLLILPLFMLITFEVALVYRKNRSVDMHARIYTEASLKVLE